ncbi:MAG: DUF2905 family protein [Deltaproteobacteria bacterium]|nr:DUF2905 family protein [Deltaproteobacteria bacterium]
MGEMGKFLIITGILLVILGVVLSLGSKVPWLGQLPGDITLRRGNLTVYFPVATCLLISAILTLVLYFLRR